MKMNFEEPKVVVESFSVTDILTASDWTNDIPLEPGVEMNPIVPGGN